ncbi:helix-turn-helix domain-containing protein [Pseudoalteromonas maricaloris]|uniref:Helix-turn-helix transcriptional regulator n=1 Tax=Pseudoalteromonas maricaloris TaxID=184924 RepID=A0A8I2H340_9GAMM|nr:helix-turn-helix transcriptional regulator [Pseudoalteromonas maricaloris]NLR23532.1 helix-turn-helix transcriptional regulator [Pseudoalteromonas maricaloris]WOX29341.1 helix-turn-helix transcriptional regulator [Pseudoalteromonas maricaloris]
MINGDDLKAMRKKAGISQEQMAKKLGCSLKTITNYELDVSDIRSKLLFQWFMYCKIDAKSLLNQIKELSSTMNGSEKTKIQDDD